MDTKTDKYLSYKEVCEIFSIKQSTLYALVSRKQVPHHRLSKRLVRFKYEEVAKSFKVITVKSTPKPEEQ